MRLFVENRTPIGVALRRAMPTLKAILACLFIINYPQSGLTRNLAEHARRKFVQREKATASIQE